MTGRPTARARSRLAIGAVVFLLGATLLGACGGGADALGHQACLDVASSIRDFAAAAKTNNPGTRAHLLHDATHQLSSAEQPAALAAASSGDWQALAATLAEAANGIPEANLVTALGDQCQQTLSGA